MLRIGIDLGGTKIEIAAYDPQGVERLRRRVPTPQGDYRATVGAVASLVEQVEAELGEADRKSTRLNSSHNPASRMPSSA
jgi:predicted NBD/HSP70 family sugar kinase